MHKLPADTTATVNKLKREGFPSVWDHNKEDNMMLHAGKDHIPRLTSFDLQGTHGAALVSEGHKGKLDHYYFQRRKHLQSGGTDANFQYTPPKQKPIQGSPTVYSPQTPPREGYVPTPLDSSHTRPLDSHGLNHLAASDASEKVALPKNWIAMQQHPDFDTTFMGYRKYYMLNNPHRLQSYIEKFPSRSLHF